MPTPSEKKQLVGKPPMFVPSLARQTSNVSKKRRKGKKNRNKRQHSSQSVIFRVDSEDDFQSNNHRVIQSERLIRESKSPAFISATMRQYSDTTSVSLTKLPALKSSTPTSSLSFGASFSSSLSLCSTPRSSIASRLPATLPANLQPGCHERRKKLPILAAIKPENERAEKERFLRANYNYNPLFIYRFPADEDILQKLGVPSDKYIKVAILIMERAIEKYGTYENFEEQTGGKVLQRSSIMILIQRYLKREELEGEIMVNLSEDLLSRGSMTRVKGKPMLNVRIVNLREYWVEGLLRHEIGTHYLRSMNNKYQDWYNWKVRKEMGLKPANPTEEGLASLHSVLLRKEPSLWRAALLYYVAYKAAFVSLKELFRDLGKFVSDPLVRWDYCMRAKRGQTDTSIPGAFCKDQVYLEGALQLLKNRRRIDFHMLTRLGKVSWEDIDQLEEHGDLRNTKVPFFMEDLPAYHKCLDRICEANGLTDEVLASV